MLSDVMLKQQGREDTRVANADLLSLISPGEGGGGCRISSFAKHTGDNMKIAIIGASRGIGFALLNVAFEEGHQVTALVRNPDKLNVSDSRLTVVKGDILDAASVIAVTAGQDAVCICIGVPPTLKPVHVFSRGTECVLAAMKLESRQKLIAVTGIGAGDSKGHGGFLYDRVINPLLLRTIYEDKDRQESIIKASKVKWLIVRPGFLTNGPRTRKYRAIENLSGVTAGKISRLDVADFMMKQLVTPTYFGKTPLLTYDCHVWLTGSSKVMSESGYKYSEYVDNHRTKC